MLAPQQLNDFIPTLVSYTQLGNAFIILLLFLCMPVCVCVNLVFLGARVVVSPGTGLQAVVGHWA